MRDADAHGIAAIVPLTVFGAPDLSIVSFGSDQLNIAALAAAMAKRGWVPGREHQPPGLHLMLSLLHELAREPYLRDLAAAVAEVMA